jgi:hypothetical protein
MTERDDGFQAGIRQQLEEAGDQLDQETLRRLRLARAEALEAAAGSRRNRLWLDVAMVGSVAALAVALWLVMPQQQNQPSLAFDDMEMLVDAEEPEFYQDLDFYYWLEQENEQG